MLFYYFKNKRELCLYLINYGLEISQKEFLEKVDITQPDFIERLKQIAEIKSAYHQRNPNMLSFLGTMFFQDELELPEDLQEKYDSMLLKRQTMLYENINTSLFRDDIDREKAFKLIQWSMEGYQNDLIMRIKYENLHTFDVAPYWDEFYDYVAILKTTFYKYGEGKA